MRADARTSGGMWILRIGTIKAGVVSKIKAERRNRSPLVKDLSTLSTLGGVPSNSAATDILLEHRGKSIDKEKKCSRLERRREVGAPRSCS
jgi:hypothetical protein